MAVNTITGTTGNDLLQGQQLSGTQNQINGLAGNDTLLAATIADSLNGGAGNDSLSFGTGLTLNGANAVGGLGNDSFFAQGTTILASSYAGESGNDLFTFSAGATNITSASVRGGEGNDTVVFVPGGANLNGFVATMGQGNDLINFTASTFVNTYVYGGLDNDTLQFQGAINASSIGANEGADRIEINTATTFTNSLVGAGKGHDVITNTAGGNGTFATTLGTIVGGEGSDTISLSLGTATNLTIFGDVSEGGDSTLGLADFIQLSAAGVQFGASSVYGGEGNDTITILGVADGVGTASAPRLFGNLGNDSISVRAGGASSLLGGDGNDTLVAAYTFTAGSIASGLNLNGGAGVDRLLFSNTSAFFQSAATLAGSFGRSVIGSFTDSGDQLVLQSFGDNAATYSAVNFLNTAAQAVAGTAVGGTASTFSGAFVYNLTGGFTTAMIDNIGASAAFKAGDMNIFEANGDTTIQILMAQTGIGNVLTAGNTASFLTFVLSANLGVINNGTAGFISRTGVNLNFGIASDSTLGRNGFTITVV